MRSRIFTALVVLALPACDGGPLQPTGDGQAVRAQYASTSISHFSTSFTATAMCTSDIGRIQFTGTIEGTDETTVDGNGETHRTRAFRVQGLTGHNLDYGTDYTVIGGAEVLSWNTQQGQVPGVATKSLHAGTLVFEPVDGGSVVVAHHAIRYFENASGEIVVDYSGWSCRTTN